MKSAKIVKKMKRKANEKKNVILRREMAEASQHYYVIYLSLLFLFSPILVLVCRVLIVRSRSRYVLNDCTIVVVEIAPAAYLRIHSMKLN